MGITSTQFATLLCCEGNWIATNMVALPNLWLLITFALLSNHVEARGCQCHVKENDAATAIESFHTYVRGFLARCSNRRRGICHKACVKWVEGAAQSRRDSHIFDTESGDRYIYSKLDCDGTRPFSQWRKEKLPKCGINNILYNCDA